MRRSRIRAGGYTLRVSQRPRVYTSDPCACEHATSVYVINHEARWPSIPTFPMYIIIKKHHDRKMAGPLRNHEQLQLTQESSSSVSSVDLTMDDLRAEPSTDHPTPEMNPALRKSDRALETRELPPSYAVPTGNTSSLVRTCQDCKKQYEMVWFWGVREMRKQGEPKSNSCLQCKAVVSVLQHTGRMSGIETNRNRFQEVLLHKAEDYIAGWRTRVSQHEAYTVPNDLSLSEVRQKLITYIAEHVQSYFANHSQVQKRQSISASRQRVQDLTEPIDEHVTSLPQKRRHNQVVLDSASLSPARPATKRRREDVASADRVEKKDQQEAMTEAASGDHVTLTEWTATWQQFESVCDGSKVRAFLRDFGAVMAMKKGLIEALKEQIQDEEAHKERVRRRKLTLLQNDASSS